MEVKGRMPWSSNATFLVELCLDGEAMAAVYKPIRGERPLWDFPPGLHRREVAAYALSEALGWALVPETVLRDDGPFGEGSFQRFVPADFEQHYFTLLEDPTHHAALRAVCAFDLVANNADRKSGHCLVGTDMRIWAIDHGICFHTEYKLRTVIWEFSEEPIGQALLDDLEDLRMQLASKDSELAQALCVLLSDAERRAVLQRAQSLLRSRCFPSPSGHRRNYPWPPV